MDIQTLFGLEGKTALVTGGATGIGRMAAEALVRAGARVLIASRKGEACEAVAKELNALGASGSAEGFAGDVGTDTDIAGCMLFLCGKGGAYITGAIVPVSGGINVMSGPNIFEQALH